MIPLCLGALLSASTAFGATAEEMAEAMEVPASDIVSITTLGDSSAWDVLPNLGVLLPTTGKDAAYLYTGRIGVPPQTGTDLPPTGTNGDDIQLGMELDAPKWANSFKVDFYFLSAEYPEFVGTVYNDKFEANVSSTAWSGNAAIDSVGNPVNINSVLFTVTNPADLSGTGFESSGGGTGWLSVVVPVTAGEPAQLDLRIFDQSDGIYDSSVLIDGFEWSESIILDPFIVEQIDIIYLSPKRGSVEGGDTTTIVGSKFNDSCVAWFDGVEALDTLYIDDEHLEVLTPAHEEGLVDVEVVCTGVDDQLVGGYTYYDVEAGELPPLIDHVDPYLASTAGGERITVVGEDFNDGAIVSIDGVEVETLYVDNYTLQATTQAHSAGLVNVAVENPSGLSDVRAGALLFEDSGGTDAPDTALDTGAPAHTGDTGAKAGPSGSTGGCGCAAGGLAGGSSLLLAGLVAAGRRRMS